MLSYYEIGIKTLPPDLDRNILVGSGDESQMRGPVNLENFWRVTSYMNRITKLILFAYFPLDGNLISQEQYDEITRGEWDNYVPLAGLDYDIDSEKPKMGASGAPIIRTQARSKIRKTPGFQGKKDPKDFIKGGRAKLDEDQRLARNVFAQAVAKLNNDTIKAQ